MNILLLMYAVVVLAFASIFLIAMYRSVAALRRSDPALYRAALDELSPVPAEAEPSRHPSTRRIHCWLRRHQRHADLRRHRALRAWITAHDLAVSGIVLLLGSMALVLMRY